MRSVRNQLLQTGAGFVATLVLTADVQAADRVIKIRPDGFIPIVVNGVSALAKISPSESATTTLSADFAKRIGLRSRKRGSQINVGPRAITTYRGEAQMTINGRTFRSPVVWPESTETDVPDITISPIDIPFSIIEFTLADRITAESEFVFPLSDFSGDGSGFGLSVAINTGSVRVFFRLNREMSLATATAGTILSNAFGGSFDGPPSSAIIAYGVSRPVRNISLTAPFKIGPLSITKIVARVRDYGDTSVVSSDPNEIVVAAVSDQKPRFSWLTIGRSDLAHCSSLEINKATRKLKLTCRLKSS